MYSLERPAFWLNSVIIFPSLFFPQVHHQSGTRPCCNVFGMRVFQSHEDVTIAGEKLQILGLCSALRAFEQGRIFIITHLL
jgi:hypothetical protein